MGLRALLISAVLAATVLGAAPAQAAPGRGPVWPTRLVQITSADPAAKGRCAVVEMAAPGAPILLEECDHDSRAQMWEALDGQDGYTRLKNVQTGLCAVGPMDTVHEVVASLCKQDANAKWRYNPATAKVERARASEAEAPWCWQMQPKFVQAETCDDTAVAQSWKLLTY